MGFSFIGRKFKNKRIHLFGKLFVISAKMQLILILISVVTVLIAGLIVNHKNVSGDVTAQITPTYSVNSIDATFVSTPTPTINNNKNIQIHISGAICSPGVVNVKENARLADVIEAAGGLKEDCDLSFINLASFVSDGSKIHIPFKGETPYYIAPKETPPGVDSIKKKININTASVAQLCTLNGVGESTAKKIIAYRESNGDFKKIEDLLRVSGIGEAKFNGLKDYICV